MKPFRLFGAIAKVEDQADGTIKVFGVASSGARDDAGEIVLPDAMRAALPDYAKYPALREMHQPSAAGRTLEAEVDGDGFTRIVAHVVDPVAISKVKSRTYSGFSIGGKVLQRDTADPTIISAIKLSEISLVDRPANPEASIDLWKADIGEQPMAYAPTNDEVKARAAEMAKAAGKTAMDAFKAYVAKAREALIAEHDAPAPTEDEIARAACIAAVGEPGEGEVIAKNAEGQWAKFAILPAVAEAVAKAAGGLKPEERDAILAKVQVAHADGGDLEDAVAKAIAEFEAARAPAPAPEDPQAALAAAIEKAKADDKPYGDVEYADPKNGKYPVDTPKHIRAAWSYINMPKNQEGYTSEEVASIKAKIVSAWKDKIDEDGPPSAEKMLAVADLGKTAAALRLIVASSDGKLVKGLYGVARFAALIDELTWLQQDATWEATGEGDKSPLPAEIADCVASLLTALAHMVAEESAEIVDAYQEQGMDIDIDASAEMEVMGLASSILDLAKSDEALMQKVGARHSKADASHIQAAHDHMAKLGAMCDPENCPDAAAAGKAALGADLAKQATQLITKQAADIAELRTTAAGEADRTAAAIDAALEKFRQEKLPPKTAASTHARIGKTDDVNPGAEPVDDATKAELAAWWAGLTPEQRAFETMKATLSAPVQAR